MSTSPPYPKIGEPVVALLDAQYRVNPNGNSSRSLQRNVDNLTRNLKSISPSGKKAIILSGYQSDFSEDLCPIRSDMEEAGFSLDFVVDVDMCGRGVTTFDEAIIGYVIPILC